MIRHCVSIDERRAKFRQDLIYQNAENKKKSSSTRRSHRGGNHLHHRDRHDDDNKDHQRETEDPTGRHERYRLRRAAVSPTVLPPQPRASADQGGGGATMTRGRHETLDAPSPLPTATAFRPRSRSKSRGGADGAGAGRLSTDGAMSQASHAEFEYDSDSDDGGQDIDEIWFAGGHGDVGGVRLFLSPFSLLHLATPTATACHHAQLDGELQLTPPPSLCAGLGVDPRQ